MSFEWDLEKDASNLAKHGVSFAESATAFWDPLGGRKSRATMCASTSTQLSRMTPRHTTSRLGLFSAMLVATVAALGSVSCQKGSASPPIASATGRVASTDQLLEEIFASLEDLRTLDTVAQRASSTPGVGSVQRDQKAHALQIDFAPPIAAEDVAVLAGWSETFLVESRRDHSWFLVVYDRQSRHGGSYNQVSFNVPEHGRWRVVAVAARRPTGPPPDIGSGASGAYPLADYPISISSIVIQPLEGA